MAALTLAVRQLQQLGRPHPALRGTLITSASAERNDRFGTSQRGLRRTNRIPTIGTLSVRKYHGKCECHFVLVDDRTLEVSCRAAARAPGLAPRKRYSDECEKRRRIRLRKNAAQVRPTAARSSESVSNPSALTRQAPFHAVLLMNSSVCAVMSAPMGSFKSSSARLSGCETRPARSAHSRERDIRVSAGILQPCSVVGGTRAVRPAATFKSICG